MALEQITGVMRTHSLYDDEVVVVVTSALGAYVDEFKCHTTAVERIHEMNHNPAIRNYFKVLEVRNGT